MGLKVGITNEKEMSSTNVVWVTQSIFPQFIWEKSYQTLGCFPSFELGNINYKPRSIKYFHEDFCRLLLNRKKNCYLLRIQLFFEAECLLPCLYPKKQDISKVSVLDKYTNTHRVHKSSLGKKKPGSVLLSRRFSSFSHLFIFTTFPSTFHTWETKNATCPCSQWTLYTFSD